MLNDYKDKQWLAYNLFYNDLKNNCVTHAYLIDENNYSESFGMVLSFVKSILCENNNVDNDVCNKCSLCKRIDDGNYPEVKIISPEGMFIKKQQILDLQQLFSRTAVEGKKRVYIIRDCEKMRSETANSMLKFLEEPEAGVIAILMTNNINNVLSTIISRCKVIKFNNDNLDNIDDGLNDLAFDFVYGLEHDFFNVFVKIKDIWFSKITSKERDKMVMVFDKIIDIYYDLIKIKMCNDDIKCKKWKDKLIEISNVKNINDIINKINIILDAKDSIKYNVNSNLLIDSVIVSIGGIINGSRN